MLLILAYVKVPLCLRFSYMARMVTFQPIQMGSSINITVLTLAAVVIVTLLLLPYALRPKALKPCVNARSRSVNPKRVVRHLKAPADKSWSAPRRSSPLPEGRAASLRAAALVSNRLKEMIRLQCLRFRAFRVFCLGFRFF